jgi:type IV pilus assembly protein PilC
MPEYNYIICDDDGKRTQGTLIADSESDVLARIRKDEVIIISIEEVKTAFVPDPVPLKAPARQKIRTKDIVVFSRQFATLVDAHVPILQAMEVLVDQTVNPSLRHILAAISGELREGNGLSVSFAKFPRVFDPLYVNMLRVGEAGGILNEVLERTALFLEKSENFRQKIQGAMVYPIVILCIAFSITTGLIIFVVPTFSHIYDSLGQKLPAMTQMLIDLSYALRKYAYIFVIVIVGAVMLFKRYRKTPQGSLEIDRFLLKLPVFGEMLCKVTVSRFCHTFATLMQSGVPILDSLEVVKQSSGNRVIELLTEDLMVSVREGEGIAVTLLKTPVFPVMVTRMISIGEKSGQLDKMLTKVAEFYDEEMDAAMESLTKIIEPLIIGFLGIVIGFIVIALFLPILNMASAVH